MEEKGSGRESEGEGKRRRSERGERKEVDGPATLQYFELEPPHLHDPKRSVAQPVCSKWSSC